MSVQLIVYPQNYDGQYNVISGNPTNVVVNGIDFTGLNSTPSYDSSASNPSQDTIINAQPTIPNSWYRFRSTTPTAPDLPTVSSGRIVFYIPPAAIGSVTGVYQRLGNLVVGQQYEVNLTMGAGSEGIIVFQVYDGTTFVSSALTAVGTPTITHTFTATAPDNIVMVYYYTTVEDVVNIEEISVSAVSTSANTTISNGQVICDLYEDEDIPLSLSVDDFKNVAEKVQSYSKAFNLPATKRNNRIFDQIFEITRSYDGVIFNPYRKTQCVLKQDGFILFEGYLRLLDVTDKEGEVSYNVNLYSEVVALADVLGDLTFSDLDFTELQHDYNKTQITISWNDTGSGITYTNPNNSGFRDANSTVKYPFVNWNNQMLIANGSVLGGATAGNPELTSLEQAFRPFINIKYLIDRIFEAIPFTYESEFFDTTDFKKLYMDFNWGGDNIPTAQNETYLARWKFNVSPSIPSNIGNNSFKEFHLIPETISPQQAPSELPPNYDAATNIITATTDNEIYDISYTFLFGKTSSTSESIECQWLHNSTPINQQTVFFPAPNTVRSYTGNLQISLQTGDTLSAQFKGDTDIRQNETFASSCVFVQSSSTISSTTLHVLRGELGQWDFLKGLITMFNLVTLPDEDNPNNIKIEPYSDVFITPALTTPPLDWTDKIDVSEMKLEPLTDLNKKTIFKFVEDDDDFAFTNYKNQLGGHLYGSKKYDAGNEFNILKGTDEIVAEPFAATVVKPLMSQFPSFITPALYSMNDDGTSEGFENSPRIMFNNGIKDTGASYYIPAQNGGTSANETDYLQFSHLSDVPTITGSRDFHFGECQLLVGASTTNNLFNLHWLPYFSELYNPNTRTMTIKVNLTAADINTFKFNDTVYIKNRVFRVNKIDYKPNDLATVEFILIP
jgi:hypothetical protein